MMHRIEPASRVFVLDTGRLPQATYDLMDRVTALGVGGTTVDSWTYDAVGQPTTRTDGDNGLTTWTYDSMGRKTQSALP